MEVQTTRFPEEWHGQATVEDERLRAGAVPQPEDWVRVWRAIRKTESWSSSAAGTHTDQWISQTRARVPLPRALMQLTWILQEVVREQHRRDIQTASAISNGLDDRGGYTLVRFRCVSFSSPAASRGGVLGCANCLGGVTLAVLESDYAERAAGEGVEDQATFCSRR